MVLRPLLKSDGTKKEGWEKNNSLTQAKGGKRERKKIDNSRELLVLSISEE